MTMLRKPRSYRVDRRRNHKWDNYATNVSSLAEAVEMALSCTIDQQQYNDYDPASPYEWTTVTDLTSNKIVFQCAVVEA